MDLGSKDRIHLGPGGPASASLNADHNKAGEGVYGRGVREANAND